MGYYLLGLGTLPALAALWFIVLFLWYNVLTPSEITYTCRCGARWGKGYTRHPLVLAAPLCKYHHKRCQTSQMFREWLDANSVERKAGRPTLEKSPELRKLLDEGFDRRNAR